MDKIWAANVHSFSVIERFHMLLEAICYRRQIKTTHITDIGNNCHTATSNSYVWEQYFQTPLSMACNSTTLMWSIFDICHRPHGCIMSAITYLMRPLCINIQTGTNNVGLTTLSILLVHHCIFIFFSSEISNFLSKLI